MAKKQEREITADDLDYGTRFVGQNSTNPLFTEIFNQPAEVDETKFEYKVISTSELHEFPNHPYKVVVNDEMLDLRDSIVDNGVVTPLIVIPRNIGGGYTIISGHRRCKACELAKITKVPVIIAKNLNDAQATIMMVDSNKQRETILPSEKAFAYKMRLEAMKRQGQRTDLTSSPVETKLPTGRADKELAQEVGDSRATIHRYIRLTYLIPQLLDLVDNDVKHESPSIAFRPAIEISYLSNEEQKFFYDTVKTLGKTPSVQQATKIKQLSKDGTLTQTNVMEILVQDKPNQKETVRVDYERLGCYFDETLTPNQCEKKVFDSLESLTKFRQAINKHIKGKNLTDDEMAKLIDNLLTQYVKSQKQKTNDYIR